MGEVYRARDERLQRDVAVKLLPEEFRADPDRLRRFEQEARAAAALNHPNILAVYDVGTSERVPYFVSELLTGETVRARLDRGVLPAERVAAWGAQIARGLAAAHDHGIVHRDLKPENLFVTTDGQVKILDFGIAKASPRADADGDSERGTMVEALATETGAILGTVPYMSPEQVRGAPADGRSDIFSLGAVLFEMLTGRPAFAAPSLAETMSAILTRDPFSSGEPPLTLQPDVPIPLIQVVRHCLEKDLDHRFQSARDIAFGLEVLSGTPGRIAPAVDTPSSARRAWTVAAGAAVVLALAATAYFAFFRQGSGATLPQEAVTPLAALPLANLSGKAEDEYFADGMTDSLITDLARAPSLAVIARGAAFRYKDRTIDPQEAGHELGARYVLHGSVQRSGDRVRVNVRLVEVSNGYNVWAEAFEENIKDLFVIQSTISGKIVEALQSKLAPAPARAVPARPTSSEQAYDAYLQGLFYAHKGGKADTERAVTFLEQAVAIDSEFALAQASLGSLYTRVFFYYDADRRWQQKAVVAIDKALSLDADLAEGYLARGQLTWNLPNGFPHERAVRDLRHAIALKPSLADAHVELGKIYLHIGLLDKAIEENGQALRLDPGNPAARGRLALSHIYLRECQTAYELGSRDPEFRRVRVEALACLGRLDDALQELGGTPAMDPSLYSLLLARKGDYKGARESIARAKLTADNVDGLSHLHHAQYYMGAAYALMAETRQAVSWLKKASREGLPCYPLFERSPDLDSLRQDPEFAAFLKELKAQDERFRSIL